MVEQYSLAPPWVGGSVCVLAKGVLRSAVEIELSETMAEWGQREQRYRGHGEAWLGVITAVFSFVCGLLGMIIS